MTVECPVCRTSNPDGILVCPKCATPVDTAGATIAIDVSAVAAGLGDAPNSLSGVSWAGGNAPIRDSGALEPIAPGTVLAARYEIVSLLGEGGMGSVYKAKDRELDRLIALKLLRPELADNVNVLRRFKQEIILARQITHKNVIRIFDLVVAEGRQFITMELLEGRDLMQLIVAQGKCQLAEALQIFRQALQGLQAAHQEDVVHRDLKPHNIMVDPHGRACLMDFGIARSVEAAGITRTGVLMGTPDYMSPEQARGEVADARSDLFSMGVILYEMVTGVLPYQAKTPMATLVKRTREAAPRICDVDPSVPQYVSDMVARCLEIDLDKRYQSAAEILADLDAQHVQPGVLKAAEEVRGLVPGTRLGSRYVIEKLLGQGGMGTVYKAQDEELGRTVALKLVRPELANRPAAMEKLKQELLLASRISHKHILRIHDLGDAGGVKFISMAFVDGEDLHERIRSLGRLPVDQAVKLAKQVCQALEAAHEEGIIHRDLKPQNVLVSGDDHVCIADFGLATSFEALEPARTQHEILGTPRYMAPEQAESRTADHRADIYSFGLILYEMVTGDVPFASDTVMQAMFQRVTQTPKSPKLLNPGLPDNLVAVIMRCLEREPEDRYQSAGAILTDLENVERELAHPRANPVTKAQPRRWPWMLGAGAAALLAIVVAIPQTRHAILRGTGFVSDSSSAKYLAVLPLKVTGDDAALGLAADGVFDTLNTRLAQLKEVHLSSPTAAAKVDNSESLPVIARTLGAKLVFYGSGYTDNGRIELIVSLSEPGAGKRLWTRKFSGLPQDILTIQDEIYNQLIAALGLRLSGEELARGAAQPTQDIGAYDLYLQGRNLLRGKRDEKNLTDALALFQGAAQKDGNFALAYTGIADASRYLYDLKKDGAWATRALGAAERAQQLDDRLPEVHFALGSVYTDTGKTSAAITELQRALALAPNSDEAYRRLGRAYSKAGRKDDAIKAFQKAADANPYYWLNHNLLGIAHLESGNTDAALQDFRRVTESDPKLSTGWENIASVYHNQGKWQESAEMFKKAAEVQPSGDVYSNLGASVFFLGRCDEARGYFAKADAMNPGQYLTIGNLAQSYRCLGQDRQARQYYEQAINLALQTLQVNPKDAPALSWLGLYYAELGDAARGLEFARRARSVDSQDADLMYRQAAVFALAGDEQKAVATLKQALRGGYSVKEAASDPDLKRLRNNPEFRKLTATQ